MPDEPITQRLLASGCPLTVEHEQALEFLKKHRSIRGGGTEEERILADLAAAGFAKKVGDAYVYTGDGDGPSSSNSPSTPANEQPTARKSAGHLRVRDWLQVVAVVAVLALLVYGALRSGIIPSGVPEGRPVAPPSEFEASLARIEVLAGSPSWLDDQIPLKARIESYLQTNLTAGRDWKDVSEGLAQRLGVEPERLRALYQQAQDNKRAHKSFDFGPAIQRLDLRASPAQHKGHEDITAPGPPLPADVIFSRCSPAVVQVVIQDRRDRTIGSGSGFLVHRNGLIATNYHVVKDAHMMHVVLADKTKLPVAATVAQDDKADVAIIKVDGKIGAQPLVLAGDELPPVGSKVFAIGNPRGFSNTLSDGLVSAHRAADDLAGFLPITMIQTTAPMSPGSSGGPLLAADGRVIGVTTSYFGAGQNLNFAVPASHIARLLREHENKEQLAQSDLVRQADAAVYVVRGSASMEKGDPDKAIEEFSEAIRRAPRYGAAYAARGVAWSRKRESVKAISDFDEAIRLDPQNDGAFFNRGNAWKEKNDYDSAINDFTQAIRFNPDCAAYFHARGIAWLDRSQFDKAIKNLGDAIRLDPKNALYYHSRGRAWYAKTEFDEAKKDFDKASSLDPKKYPPSEPGPVILTTMQRVERFKNKLRRGMFPEEVIQFAGKAEKEETYFAGDVLLEFNYNVQKGAVVRVARFLPFEMPGVATPRYRVNLLYAAKSHFEPLRLEDWHFRSPD